MTDRRNTSSTARPRPSVGAPGAKLLITIGTVAATVFGWATLTEQNRLAQKQAAPIEPAAVDPGAAVRALAAGLAPIPTLVPRPAIDLAQTTMVQPASPVVQSAPAVVDAPVLRVVNPPPAAPVTTTRTSR